MSGFFRWICRCVHLSNLQASLFSFGQCDRAIYRLRQMRLRGFDESSFWTIWPFRNLSPTGRLSLWDTIRARARQVREDDPKFNLRISQRKVASDAELVTETQLEPKLVARSVLVAAADPDHGFTNRPVWVCPNHYLLIGKNVKSVVRNLKYSSQRKASVGKHSYLHWLKRSELKIKFNGTQLAFTC